jgi:hypothetical protein
MEKVQEFIAAIEREQAKRWVTYPKMLTKLRSKIGNDKVTLQDYYDLVYSLEKQEDDLRKVKITLEAGDYGTDEFYIDGFRELVREMDMRLRYYPIMIIRHQISKEDAEIEKRVWRELVEYFNEKYCPSIEIQFLKTRCKIINQCLTKS